MIGVDKAADKLAMLSAGRSPIVEAEIDRIIADAVAAGRLTAMPDAGEAVARTDVSFISVGTPTAADGTVSMHAVEQVAGEIGRALRDKSTPHRVVMRSTVPPGTAEERVIPILEEACGRRHGDGFLYYSNPEFLREGSSVRDFRAPPFTLIGRTGRRCGSVARSYAGIAAPVHVAPYRVAESVKYLCNVFHAVKLAFANEAGSVLAAHGVDAREAFRLFCEDRVLNISTAYLRPGFAFGGSCLPKDVRGFLALADAAHVPTPRLATSCKATARSSSMPSPRWRDMAASRSACSAWHSSQAPTICANRPSSPWPSACSAVVSSCASSIAWFRWPGLPAATVPISTAKSRISNA